MKKVTLLSLGILVTGVAFFMPGKAYATTYVQQTTAETITGATFFGGYTQKLGTGLNGTFVTGDQYSIYAYVIESTTTVGSITSVIAECPSNVSSVFGTGCSWFTTPTTTSIPAGTQGLVQLFFSMGGDHSFNPTKYYYILNEIGFSGKTSSGLSNVQLAGSLTNTYTAGTFQNEPNDCNSSQCSNGNVVDSAFIIAGTLTNADSSYVKNLVPKNLATTTTSTTFSFDYHAATGQGIVSYAIRFQDVSAGTAAIVISGSASTGDHSVSRTVQLTDGDVYTWQAEICDGNGTCYSGAAQNEFGVGTSSQSKLNSYFQLPDGTGNVATGSSDFYGVIPIFSSWANHIPICYVTQFANIFASSTANITSSTSMPLIEIDLSHKVGSTTVAAGIYPDIKITASDILNYMGSANYNALRLIQTTSIYIAGLLYFWHRGRRIFKTTNV